MKTVIILALALLAGGSRALALDASALERVDYWNALLRTKNVQHFDRRGRITPALPKPTGRFAFPQLIDHDHPGRGTFLERYYLNDSFAAGASAPVLIYDCGEAGCDGDDIFGAGAFPYYARKFGAHMVALEHRFYGQSLPFPKLTSGALADLTTRSALEDLASFQAFAVRRHNLQGKWVIIGGSYPGNLAAYYRVSYPTLVAGALASSAPVRASDGFEEYDRHLAQKSGSECVGTLRRAWTRLEDATGSEAETAKIKRFYHAERVTDFLDLVNLIDNLVEAGLEDPSHALCNLLTRSADPGQTLLNTTSAWLKQTGVDPVELTFEGSIFTGIEPLPVSGGRAWLYQQCTEFGYFHVANPDPRASVKPRLMTRAYFQGVCNRVFGNIKDLDTTWVNEHLFQPLLNPSNPGASRILFTNGTADLWSLLSIIPPSNNPKLSTFVIPGGTHIEDLGPIAPAGPVREAQETFLRLLSQWLAP